MLKRLILTLLILLMALPILAQEDDYEADKQRAIEIAAADELFVDWLAEYPDWTGDGWLDDVYWHIDFYSEAVDEWLGYALVDLTTETVTEAYAPIPLSPAEYAEIAPRIEEYINADPEIQTIMEYPDFWDVWIDWNRWDQRWEAYLNWGIEQWLVTFYIDEVTDEIGLDEIRDANLLEAEQAERDARDQAVALAYEADEIDQALEGYDDWTTYVSPQGEHRYIVNFVVEEAMLFYALVDIETWEIIDAGM